MTDSQTHRPRALVVRTAGINCDHELRLAFQRAGAHAEFVHLDRLIENPSALRSADLIGFPGGFSYGDDIAAGRVFAAKVRQSLYPALREAADRGVPIIGVCNGFQVLIQSGLLPAFPSESPSDTPPRPVAALAANDAGRFIDRWTNVAAPENTVCIWTRGLTATSLPIANGEGRFVTDNDTLAQLRANGQVALRYAEPVNGSIDDIAGICDPSGRIFGLMPHPERFLEWNRRPDWTRIRLNDDPAFRQSTPGLRIFENAVRHAAQNATAASA